MMIVPPERIAFEHEDDVIDYVTKGFPPSKKKSYSKACQYMGKKK